MYNKIQALKYGGITSKLKVVSCVGWIMDVWLSRLTALGNSNVVAKATEASFNNSLSLEAYSISPPTVKRFL